MPNLIRDYIEFYADSEIPDFYSRWSLLSALGANSGLRVHFKFGGHRIKPNLYVMLMGSSGARKSTAIANARKLLQAAGHSKIAANKTSKERFLLDLSGTSEDGMEIQDISEGHEVIICADEANDFFGINNIEFLSILGSLWDASSFESRIKGGPSAVIHEPSVSILSGNTATNFAKAFPPDIIGQGFFSRLIIAFSTQSPNRVAFPNVSEDLSPFVDYFQRIQIHCNGEMRFTPEAKTAATQIYNDWKGFDDPRFESYGNRRHVHLIKLCMCVALSKIKLEMDMETLIEANTILSYTEHLMPRALGEYGRSRNSALAHQVMTAIEAVFRNKFAPVTIPEIWKAVAQDVDSRTQLSEIIRNLQDSGKINNVPEGILPKKTIVNRDLLEGEFIDMSILTKREREI